MVRLSFEDKLPVQCVSVGSLPACSDCGHAKRHRNHTCFGMDRPCGLSSVDEFFPAVCDSGYSQGQLNGLRELELRNSDPIIRISRRLNRRLKACVRKAPPLCREFDDVIDRLKIAVEKARAVLAKEEE